MLRITGLKLRPGEPETRLADLAAKELGQSPEGLQILKASIDARKKSDVHWVYAVACQCRNEAAALRRSRTGRISQWQQISWQFPDLTWRGAPPQWW